MPPGATQKDGPPAASVCAEDGSKRALAVLRKRADFLACARARKAPAPAFLLQARRRPPEAAPDACIRVGFTASKKVGNAVARNRAKRRLRALARLVLAEQGRCGWDYVLVARRDETARRAFAAMEADLAGALERIHAPRPPS